MAIKIRFVTNNDWSDVKRIYKAGIETKMATFESNVPESYEEWFGQADAHCSFVKDFGERIQQLREQKGMSIAELAKKSKMNEDYLMKTEKNLTKPSKFLFSV